MTTTTVPPPKNPRCHILKVALASRIVLLFAMSLSCAILPDFNPGDDVLRFELRLSPDLPSAGEDERGDCFCLVGHACDPFVSSRRRRLGFDKERYHCADSDFGRQSTLEGKPARLAWLDNLYGFILPPVTKWDAARFLTLAVDPWARYPIDWDEIEYAHNDTASNDIPLQHDGTCETNASFCDISSRQQQQDEFRFYSSEQSHAFMPMFPLCIRYFAKALVFVLPRNMLPRSFEATTALSSIIINMLSFVIAAVALYDLTLYIMMGEVIVRKSRNNSARNNDGENEKASASIDNYQVHQQVCTTVATLFCINPAGVFFTTAYSESMFAMLIFTGHALAARGRYFSGKDLLSDPRESLHRYQVVWAKFYPVPTNILWCLASYTRSNGMLSSSIWWLLFGLGKFCLRVNNSNVFRDSASAWKVVFRFAIVSFNCMFDLLYHAFLGFIVAIPVLYHDWQGYSFHCTQSTLVNSRHVPQWCNNVNNNSFSWEGFSLYAYVQQKHWNVGLFRYYEIKQIPNFILALPVLVLGTCAVVRWIHVSLCRHKVRTADSFPGTLVRVCQWAIQALGDSVIPNLSHARDDVINKKHAVMERSLLEETGFLALLLGSTVLSYYAILFGFVLIGSFLAHVQISTRLICSTCPAFYWFLVILFLGDNTESQIETQSNDSCQRERSRTDFLRNILWFYFALYNLLGVIMHVNFLPWT
ncbi:hypothetical protein HJC23_010463 [Cyclotella cryptica]|uniref:GPI mannosyltransferase 2 n=1 Tax=Cyclotella cryptica TaxID=29204 RepID=A0ABD3QIU9_9STRA|eukprot:CCRYP_005329-RA/>CCRYP_005329-RA protein AED:0.23 eAED:0.23 QI:0/-1/0/1/-1/1/1/0/702